MAETDMTLLRMAARVDPHLRDAVDRVDAEARALRESHDALEAAAKEAERILADVIRDQSGEIPITYKVWGCKGE